MLSVLKEKIKTDWCCWYRIGGFSIGIREWLIPEEKKFFDLSEQQAKKVHEGAKLFHELITDFRDVKETRAKIKKIEHEADGIVHETFNELNRSFITPIDREDIISLAMSLDDVIDLIYAAANRISIYEIKKPTKCMKEFSRQLVEATGLIVKTTSRLKHLKNGGEIDKWNIEIHRIENDADELLNIAISELFREKDPIKIMKLKEIYDCLELATDKCENFADVVNNILIKHG